MKRIEIQDATSPLAEYAGNIKRDRILVTKKGKPDAALVTPDDFDWETLSLSLNPEFIELLEHLRESYRRYGGIPLHQVREELVTYNAKAKRREHPRQAAHAA
jgi:PHD/YefM family antitoxin component YafN of YafNO toxin-antitoxin module